MLGCKSINYPNGSDIEEDNKDSFSLVESLNIDSLSLELLRLLESVIEGIEFPVFYIMLRIESCQSLDPL